MSWAGPGRDVDLQAFGELGQGHDLLEGIALRDLGLLPRHDRACPPWPFWTGVQVTTRRAGTISSSQSGDAALDAKRFNPSRSARYLVTS